MGSNGRPDCSCSERRAVTSRKCTGDSIGGNPNPDEKNAAEAALKVWRRPSMKESLLASRSIPGLTSFIYYKTRNYIFD
ncbi:hypothetical protein QFZ91_002635 [Paraburkholderia sp. JPY419]